jgi:hypothetical protein
MFELFLVYPGKSFEILLFNPLYFFPGVFANEPFVFKITLDAPAPMLISLSLLPRLPLAYLPALWN